MALAPKNPLVNAGDTRWEDPLEQERATLSSILVWKMPCTGEPGGLQSTGHKRVRQD